jgi:hypothetical protein
MTVGRQVGQKVLDFRRPHGVGMAQPVEADEALGPHGVAILGARRELAYAAGPAEAVQQAGRFRAGQVADRQAQDVVIEEGKGRVGFLQLIQGLRFGLGHMLQEAEDVARRKVAGVADVVE